MGNVDVVDLFDGFLGSSRAAKRAPFIPDRSPSSNRPSLTNVRMLSRVLLCTSDSDAEGFSSVTYHSRNWLAGVMPDSAGRIVSFHDVDARPIRKGRLGKANRRVWLQGPGRRYDPCCATAKALDCLIAASCVRTGAPLLHADEDFDRLATCAPLRIWTG